VAICYIHIIKIITLYSAEAFVYIRYIFTYHHSIYLHIQYFIIIGVYS